MAGLKALAPPGGGRRGCRRWRCGALQRVGAAWRSARRAGSRAVLLRRFGGLAAAARAPAAAARSCCASRRFPAAATRSRDGVWASAAMGAARASARPAGMDGCNDSLRKLPIKKARAPAPAGGARRERIRRRGRRRANGVGPTLRRAVLRHGAHAAAVPACANCAAAAIGCGRRRRRCRRRRCTGRKGPSQRVACPWTRLAASARLCV